MPEYPMLKARTRAEMGCRLASALTKPTTMGKAAPAKPMAIPVTNPAKKGRNAIINAIGTLDLESSLPARGISPEESSIDSKIMTPARVIKTFTVFFEAISENIFRLRLFLFSQIIVRLISNPVSMADSFQEAGFRVGSIF